MEAILEEKRIKAGNRKQKMRWINPMTDLTVACANCHSMIHRRKDTILKREGSKKMIKK
jgi:predicted HNH restriction endonuclease